MDIKKIIKKVIPKPFIPKAKRLYYLSIKPIEYRAEQWKHIIPDKIELFMGKRDSLTPPAWKIFVGGGDFKAIGEEFLCYFKDIGGLKPWDKVLDVGCGIGRMAVPLTRYLSGDCSYEGFDIVSDGISWCKKNITPLFPNFRFSLANVYNFHYNPLGTIEASKYKFPYEDLSFDFVFLTSVFTHMLTVEMENYLAEIRRVLKIGGRCLITYFLLNEGVFKLIEKGSSTLSFKYEAEGCRIDDNLLPEAAVGFDEIYIKELFQKNNLEIKERPYYGSWCGREKFTSYQDIIIATRIS